MDPPPYSFRNALLSIYQSAVREIGALRGDAAHRAALSRTAAQVAAAKVSGMHVPATPPPSSVGDLWVCARLGLEYLEARLRGDPVGADRLRSQLIGSPCDPGWASTLDAYVGYFGPDGTRRAIPYVTAAQVGDRVIPIAPDTRLALISDWGTGSPAAHALLRRVAAERPDVLIHLGDIYYSGTPQECDRHFLHVIEAVLGSAGQRIPCFTLSGNHDMYSGGVGYYALLDRLNAGPMRQGASFFCLRSTDEAWQVLALDTGLHDHDPFDETDAETFLDPSEEAWHVARIRAFPGRTILLSHHPLFSAFRQIGHRGADGTLSPINAPLLASLRRLQAAGRIAAWFWGHEHNLCIYRPYAGLERGRCVGNGAIPVFVRDAPYGVLDGVRDPPALIEGTELGNDGTVMAHGFTTVTLGRTTRAAYFEAGRTAPLYAETLEPDVGPVQA